MNATAVEVGPTDATVWYMGTGRAEKLDGGTRFQINCQPVLSALKMALDHTAAERQPSTIKPDEHDAAIAGTAETAETAGTAQWQNMLNVLQT